MQVFKRKRSPNYYVRFCLGGREHKFSLRTADRRVADRRAAEIFARETRRHLGLIDDQVEHAKRPLEEHLADFESMLKAKRVTDAHRCERLQHLRDFVAFTGARRLADLRDGVATTWIPVLREKLSARSVNKRIASLRQLGRWLRRTRRMPFDPFEILTLQNEEEDRRHVRRALTYQEFYRLLDAARSRPLDQAREQRTLSGVTEREERRLRALGEARVLVYLLAAGAGLRRSEMYRLQCKDVDFENDLIRLVATKTGRAQAVALHPDLREVLRQACRDRAPCDTLVPERCFPNSRTFTIDLRAAGIPKEDEQGRTVDLHALRGTMLTWLKNEDVHPAVAKRAARHAKIDTTIRHYTHVVDDEVKAALARIPLLPPEEKADE